MALSPNAKACLHCHIGEQMIEWFKEMGLSVTPEMRDEGYATALNALTQCVAELVSGAPEHQRDTIMLGVKDALDLFTTKKIERRAERDKEAKEGAPEGATKH